MKQAAKKIQVQDESYNGNNTWGEMVDRFPPDRILRENGYEIVTRRLGVTMWQRRGFRPVTQKEALEEYAKRK